MCRPYFRDIEKKRYMAKNYFDRYVWLINTIDRHGHISKEDIDELWYRSPLNEKRDKKLPERTFHNHREAILETFGIEIKCDRSLGYYIANSEDLEADGIRHWLLESLSMNNMLNETRDMPPLLPQTLQAALVCSCPQRGFRGSVGICSG